jgi:hypothetical protein
MLLRVGLFATALTCLTACSGALAQGKTEFKTGHYAEARETLLAAEPESRTWDDRHRAEYALYRGLVHAALGDRSGASVWLREAKAIEDAHPGALAADDMTRLQRGLEGADPALAPLP